MEFIIPYKPLFLRLDDQCDIEELLLMIKPNAKKMAKEHRIKHQQSLF